MRAVYLKYIINDKGPNEAHASIYFEVNEMGNKESWSGLYNIIVSVCNHYHR